MKDFEMLLSIHNSKTGEEMEIDQFWSGEDIDDASEKARATYEERFENKPHITYQIGEFVEIEKDN